MKSSIGILLLVSACLASTAYAGCGKTLMGSDCAKEVNGVSSHMRGNAAANAKAAKELKAAKSKAKAKAVAMKK